MVFPFLGVTVTVTLQDPVLSPFRLVPETLQNFTELRTTFSDTFEVEATVSLANLAMDLAVVDFFIVTVGAVLIAGTGSDWYSLQFPALSLIRTSIEEDPYFFIELEETVIPISLRVTETLAE